MELVPLAVSPRTSTIPEPLGLEATIVVGDRTATLMAGCVPNSTVEELVKPVPSISTWSPPLLDPTLARRLVTLGGAGGTSFGQLRVSAMPTFGGGTAKDGV